MKTKQNLHHRCWVSTYVSMSLLHNVIVFPVNSPQKMNNLLTTEATTTTTTTATKATTTFNLRLLLISLIAVIAGRTEGLPATLRLGAIFDHNDHTQELAFKYAIR